jgi:hypothetical protein
MGRWQSKFLFGLIVYFGGFATAIYYLSPVSQDAAKRTERHSSLNWPGKTNLNADSCRTAAGQLQEKMQTVVAFAEEQAKRVAGLYLAQTAGADETRGGNAATE